MRGTAAYYGNNAKGAEDLEHERRRSVSLWRLFFILFLQYDLLPDSNVDLNAFSKSSQDYRRGESSPVQDISRIVIITF